MRMTMLGGLLAAAMLAAGGGAGAQGLFAPAFAVNGEAVSNWQVDQRALFLGVLGAPGATREGAREALLTEAIQVQAARSAGVAVTPEEIAAGQEEFAARGGLEVPRFLALLEQNGIAPETFRDFVSNGLHWRGYVQGRFGPLARPSDADVLRAATRGADRGAIRVLMSEIAIPQDPQTREEVAALAQRLAEQIAGEAQFADAARRVSRAATAPRGGRLDWLPLSQLPPQIGSAVLGLSPGEVSEPVDLGGFVALFLLRDLDDSAVLGPDPRALDFAEYLIPGGRTAPALARAAAIDAVSDGCDDLYEIARATPAEDLRRRSAAPGSLPADLASVLAVLDPGEVSTLLTEGGRLRMVMLCDRAAEPAPEEDLLQRAGQAILRERIETYADILLEELRAEAIVTDG